ncbi:hypothetical protein AFERRID_12950 [Acidithiobacillus ferridurans]|uniref:Uncharacterized protein n=1 Tax=Acidithiobacillus ferridurans TaxID=1232575 RepID=A0A2Z6IK42_ACIFI|nr:hypothetical protein AFERRID_12950 [Acidithiobacillus ferridurans]
MSNARTTPALATTRVDYERVTGQNEAYWIVVDRPQMNYI